MQRNRLGKAALAAGLMLGLLVTACGGSSGEATPAKAAQGNREVIIEMFRFQPASLRVEAGSTVVWTNRDQILHTVTAGTPGSPSGAFDGQLDGSGSSFSNVFTQAGTFAYFCARHNAMLGEVQVVMT